MLAKLLPSAACWQRLRAVEPPSLSPLREMRERRTEEDGNEAKMERPELGLGPGGQQRPWSGCLPRVTPRPFQAPCRGSWSRGWGGRISGYLQPAAVLAGCGFPQQKPPGGWPQGPQLSPMMFQVVLLLRNPLPGTSRASPGLCLSQGLHWPQPHSPIPSRLAGS